MELVAKVTVGSALVLPSDCGHHLLRHADERIDVFWLVQEPAPIGKQRVELVGFLHPADDGLLGREVVFHVSYALCETHGVSSFRSSGSSSISRSRSNSDAGDASRLRTAASSRASRSSSSPSSRHLRVVCPR